MRRAAMFWETYAAALLALATKEAIQKTYEHVYPSGSGAPAPTVLEDGYSHSESDDGHYANL